jgi:hypothetical protein
MSMSRGSVRIGVGTKVIYDGELTEVVELQASATTKTNIMLRNGRGKLIRVSVRELLDGKRARVVVEQSGPASDDPGD